MTDHEIATLQAERDRYRVALERLERQATELYRGIAPMTAETEARLNSDTADYYAERRLKAVKRYLRERAAR